MPDACFIRIFTCFERIGAQARLHFRRKNSYEMNGIGFNGSTVLTLLAVFCRIKNGASLEDKPAWPYKAVAWDGFASLLSGLVWKGVAPLQLMVGR